MGKVVRPNGKSAGSRLAAEHTAFCTDSKAAAYRPPAQLKGSLSLACAGQATWFRLGPEGQVKSLPPPLAGLVMITLGLQGHLSPTCPPTLAPQEGALYEQQAPERQLHPESQHCLPLQGPSSHTPAPINPLTFASFPVETQAVHVPVSPTPGPSHPPQATACDL